MGVDGLAKLTSMLSFGEFQNEEYDDGREIKSNRKFIDFFRRVQIPHYEEARRKFSSHEVQQDMSGSNEYAPYTQECLKSIIEQ